MLHKALFQLDHAVSHALAIHRYPGDTLHTAIWIFNLNRVDCFAVLVAEAEARP